MNKEKTKEASNFNCKIKKSKIQIAEKNWTHYLGMTDSTYEIDQVELYWIISKLLFVLHQQHHKISTERKSSSSYPLFLKKR